MVGAQSLLLPSSATRNWPSSPSSLDILPLQNVTHDGAIVSPSKADDFAEMPSTLLVRSAAVATASEGAEMSSTMKQVRWKKSLEVPNTNLTKKLPSMITISHSTELYQGYSEPTQIDALIPLEAQTLGSISAACHKGYREAKGRTYRAWKRRQA